MTHCPYCEAQLPTHQRWCRYYEGLDAPDLHPRRWIVDGSLTAGHITATSISATHIHVGKIIL